MTRGEFQLTRVLQGFRRIVRDPPHRWLGPLVTTGAWLLKRSGMRPHAPKRNVILGLIYLYALLVLVSVGSV